MTHLTGLLGVPWEALASEVTLKGVVPREAAPSVNEHIAALFHDKLLETARLLEEVAMGQYRGVPGILEYVGRVPSELVLRGLVGTTEDCNHAYGASPMVRQRCRIGFGVGAPAWTS